MDPRIISLVKTNISKEHPEFSGCQPKISQISENKFSWIITTTITTAGGYKMQRTLRLTTDSNGRILKKTTSR